MKVMSGKDYIKLRKTIFFSAIIYSIIPSLILVSSAILLDRHFQTKPLFIVLALIISFIITNFLLLKKVKKSTSLPSNSTTIIERSAPSSSSS